METTQKTKLLALAEALREASKSKITIDPIRDNFSGLDIPAAYEVQQINNAIREKAGAIPVGKKIGLTSEKVQAQLGVNQPDFGVLFNDMEIANGGALAFAETMQPKVEAEIAFVLKKDIVSANPSLQEIEEAIDYAVASLEIVGSRIANWNINILDTVADNASASHFVVGDVKKTLTEFDYINCKMQLYINNELVSEGQGKECLGSPLIAVQWLAAQMAAVNNPLKAGDIILSGALGPMGTVAAGDTAKAVIDGLGEVAITFTR